MKRYVKSNSALSNEVREWMYTDEFDKLTSNFSRRELRMWGKILNSSDPKSYIQSTADVIDTMEIPVSNSFDEFLNILLEKM